MSNKSISAKAPRGQKCNLGYILGEYRARSGVPTLLDGHGVRIYQSKVLQDLPSGTGVLDRRGAFVVDHSGGLFVERGHLLEHDAEICAYGRERAAR